MILTHIFIYIESEGKRKIKYGMKRNKKKMEIYEKVNIEKKKWWEREFICIEDSFFRCDKELLFFIIPSCINTFMLERGNNQISKVSILYIFLKFEWDAYNIL